MPRTQLYKIRRLVKDGENKTHFEWLRSIMVDGTPVWCMDEIDGDAWRKYGAAVRECERLKVRNMDDRVLYHAVVPA